MILSSGRIIWLKGDLNLRWWENKKYVLVKYRHELFLNELFIINLRIPLPPPFLIRSRYRETNPTRRTHSPICSNRSCHFQHASVAFLASRRCPSPTSNCFSGPRSATECNSTHAHNARQMQISLRHRRSQNWPVAKDFDDEKAKARPLVVKRSSEMRANSVAKFTRECKSHARSFSSRKFPPTATQQRKRWRQEPMTARSHRPFRSKIHTFLTYQRRVQTH